MIQSNAYDYINVLAKSADAAYLRNEIIGDNIANVDNSEINTFEYFSRSEMVAIITMLNNPENPPKTRSEREERDTVHSVKKTSEEWNYALLPIWTITYRGNKGKIYSFALNGQNGASCGELPVSGKKLFGLFTIVAAVTFAIVSALEYFLC